MGDFASKDQKNPDAGFAKPGAIFDVSFAYKLGTHFGFSILLRSQANYVDEQAALDQIASQYPTYRVSLATGYWGLGGFMFGGYGSFPIAKKWSIDSRAMIGFMTATSPTYDARLIGSTNNLVILQQSSATATSFAYLVGAGLRWNVGRRICLLWNVDYSAAKPEFTTYSTNNLGAGSNNTYVQPLSTFNSALGIGYRLGTKQE